MYLISFVLFILVVLLLSKIVQKFTKSMAEDANFIRSMDESKDNTTAYSERVNEAAAVGGISGSSPKIFGDVTNASVLNKK